MISYSNAKSVETKFDFDWDWSADQPKTLKINCSRKTALSAQYDTITALQVVFYHVMCLIIKPKSAFDSRFVFKSHFYSSLDEDTADLIM